jgi:methylated-DNA-protein-cysteine methyltransferase related protein
MRAPLAVSALTRASKSRPDAPRRELHSIDARPFEPIFTGVFCGWGGVQCRDLPHETSSSDRLEAVSHYHERMNPKICDAIRDVVRAVPPGCVVTYGAVARRAGLRSARMVGRALAALPAGSGVPWHRVVNGRGMVSLPGVSGARQRTLLEGEGVLFDARDRIDLDRFGWHDDTPLR